ncbi:MAG: PTS sugar transporter subunit IIA [Myxococcota bacterium]
MRINDILRPDMVLSSVVASDKENLLKQLAEHLAQHANIGVSAEQIHTALVDRERLGSTGVGEGVAIPHAKLPGLNELTACFGRVAAGVSFDSIDQKPVKLVFVLLVPDKSAGAHLKALARISRLLRNPEFRSALVEASEPSTIYDIFTAEDAKH